jgi:thiol:disulfide interchange protein DsbD
MKHIFLFITSILLFGSNILNAQIMEPVKWKYSVKQIDEGFAEIKFIATIENTWHLYGQYSEPAGGIPLSFEFEKSSNFSLSGKVSEYPKPHKEFDDIMKANVQFFEKTATFTQKIKINSEKDFTLKVSINGQGCTTEGMCIPLNQDFEIKITGNKIISEKVETNNSQIVDTSKTDVIVKTDSSEIKKDTTSISKPEKVIEEIESAVDTNQSLWSLFLLAFLAGLAGILTPCVFPMIPMTVSFFMHDDSKEKSRKGKLEAMFFGISIIAIYTIIGTIVSIAFGPEFANMLSTHWIPNLIFFLVFIIFAFSFFGMFEIVLPNWMVSKSEAQVDKGGFFAPFFMALSLVVVSFSCTGPLVGTVLVQSAGGSFIMPIVGMLGFSLAFALPFTIFAFFPQLINKMPKSGGWLNSVKVVLGFLELALGLKFLSIVDLTYHWGLLDREVYLALWIVIFTLMGFYLLGKIKFSHDSDMPFLKVPRLMFAILTFSFVVYLIPGMIGAPLNMLSGYLPPSTTQDFDLHKVVRDNSGNFAQDACDEPKYSDVHEMPHGINGYFDYEQALKCAKELNKPIFVDFTGYACVNCRKMEDKVWADPNVLKKLNEDFIVVSLYVDDKTLLDSADWVKSDYDGKIKKTLGAKYADFQISRFGMNAQPAYILLNTDGNVLVSKPFFYDPDARRFEKYLQKGLDEFNKEKK